MSEADKLARKFVTIHLNAARAAIQAAKTTELADLDAQLQAMIQKLTPDAAEGDDDGDVC